MRTKQCILVIVVIRLGKLHEIYFLITCKIELRSEKYVILFTITKFTTFGTTSSVPILKIFSLNKAQAAKSLFLNIQGKILIRTVNTFNEPFK